MIVTGCKINSIIIAGHSHVAALLGRIAEADVKLVPIEGPTSVYGLHGPWPRTAGYWRELTRYAPGNSIALLWGGNEHYSTFLFEQPPRFDFVARRQQWLPIDKDAVLVPDALVRAKLKFFVGALHDLLVTLKKQADCPIAVVGTPPPMGDNDRLRRILVAEFGPHYEHANLTPPIILLKLWHVLQENYREQAEVDGVEFIPVPDIVTDGSGFLKPAFWGDATHANRAYGRVMLDYLSEKLLGQ